MKQFQVAYVPIGVPTFHLESAQAQFEKSMEAIRSVTEDCVFPKEMLLGLDQLDAFLDTLEPDLIILQNITFANGAYASRVASSFSCPILLWTLREPVIDGGRLRLNSLTGAYSAANVFGALRAGAFEYEFGAREEERVHRKLEATIKAAQLKKDLKSLTVAQVGHTPEGFGFGRALDTEMLRNFGVKVLSLEARELIQKAKSYTDEECAQYLSELEEATVGLQTTPT
ncbi:MAG: fucose isomerase, partial [Clostridia bacterium]|nr:fucose isomerase [Clostridia bacterium]